MEDIQSWCEVPKIAHFCSLFKAALDLPDFDIEELEESVLSGDKEPNILLLELILKLLNGCYGRRDIGPENYELYLSDIFKHRYELEQRKENPLKDSSFFELSRWKKVQVLDQLCDFRLDADDVPVLLKGLDGECMRVEPLGVDSKGAKYWYFYGTRLYKEDLRPKYEEKSPKKKKTGKAAKKKSKKGKGKDVEQEESSDEEYLADALKKEEEKEEEEAESPVVKKTARLRVSLQKKEDNDGDDDEDIDLGLQDDVESLKLNYSSEEEAEALFVDRSSDEDYSEKAPKKQNRRKKNNASSSKTPKAGKSSTARSPNLPQILRGTPRSARLRAKFGIADEDSKDSSVMTNNDDKLSTSSRSTTRSDRARKDRRTSHKKRIGSVDLSETDVADKTSKKPNDDDSFVDIEGENHPLLERMDVDSDKVADKDKEIGDQDINDGTLEKSKPTNDAAKKECEKEESDDTKEPENNDNKSENQENRDQSSDVLGVDIPMETDSLDKNKSTVETNESADVDVECDNMDTSLISQREAGHEQTLNEEQAEDGKPEQSDAQTKEAAHCANSIKQELADGIHDGESEAKHTLDNNASCGINPLSESPINQKSEKSSMEETPQSDKDSKSDRKPVNLEIKKENDKPDTKSTNSKEGGEKSDAKPKQNSEEKDDNKPSHDSKDEKPDPKPAPWSTRGTVQFLKVEKEDTDSQDSRVSTVSSKESKVVKPWEPREVTVASQKSGWHLVCEVTEDWEHLVANFKDATTRGERALHKMLRDSFLPEMASIQEEKEKEKRRREQEMAPRRLSTRLLYKKKEQDDKTRILQEAQQEEDLLRAEEEEERRQRQEVERLEEQRKQREERERAREERAKRVKLREERAKLISEGKEIPPELMNGKNDTGPGPDEQTLEDEIVAKLFKVLGVCFKHDESWPFVESVEEKIAPGYFDLITLPMNLSEMEDKLKGGKYSSKEDFVADMDLIVDNCEQYNGEEHDFSIMARNLRTVFHQSMRRFFPASRVKKDDDDFVVMGKAAQGVGRRYKARREASKRALDSFPEMLSDSEDLIQEDECRLSSSLKNPSRNFKGYTTSPSPKVISPAQATRVTYKQGSQLIEVRTIHNPPSSKSATGSRETVVTPLSSAGGDSSNPKVRYVLPSSMVSLLKEQKGAAEAGKTVYVAINRPQGSGDVIGDSNLRVLSTVHQSGGTVRLAKPSGLPGSGKSLVQILPNTSTAVVGKGLTSVSGSPLIMVPSSQAAASGAAPIIVAANRGAAVSGATPVLVAANRPTAAPGNTPLILAANRSTVSGSSPLIIAGNKAGVVSGSNPVIISGSNQGKVAVNPAPTVVQPAPDPIGPKPAAPYKLQLSKETYLQLLAQNKIKVVNTSPGGRPVIQLQPGIQLMQKVAPSPSPARTTITSTTTSPTGASPVVSAAASGQVSVGPTNQPVISPGSGAVKPVVMNPWSVMDSMPSSKPSSLSVNCVSVIQPTISLSSVPQAAPAMGTCEIQKLNEAQTFSNAQKLIIPTSLGAVSGGLVCSAAVSSPARPTVVPVLTSSSQMSVVSVSPVTPSSQETVSAAGSLAQFSAGSGPKVIVLPTPSLPPMPSVFESSHAEECFADSSQSLSDSEESPAPLSTLPSPASSVHPAPLSTLPSPASSVHPAPLSTLPSPASSVHPAPLSTLPSPASSVHSAPLSTSPSPASSVCTSVLPAPSVLSHASLSARTLSPVKVNQTLSFPQGQVQVLPRENMDYSPPQLVCRDLSDISPPQKPLSSTVTTPVSVKKTGGRGRKPANKLVQQTVSHSSPSLQSMPDSTTPTRCQKGGQVCTTSDQHSDQDPVRDAEPEAAHGRSRRNVVNRDYKQFAGFSSKSSAGGRKSEKTPKRTAKSKDTDLCYLSESPVLLLERCETVTLGQKRVAVDSSEEPQSKVVCLSQTIPVTPNHEQSIGVPDPTPPSTHAFLSDQENMNTSECPEDHQPSTPDHEQMEVDGVCSPSQLVPYTHSSSDTRRAGLCDFSNPVSGLPADGVSGGDVVSAVTSSRAKGTVMSGGASKSPLKHADRNIFQQILADPNSSVEKSPIEPADQ